jgi:hypothetical protein
MIDGIISGADNERLRFAHGVLERAGIQSTRREGDRAKRYLAAMVERVVRERQNYNAILESVARREDVVKFRTHSTLFRERGLSSDTSLPVMYGTERALAAMGSRTFPGSAGVRRVAIIGPGLDFADKQDGFDFYPSQTIQPFAVLDSLIRLGLASPSGVELTTADLSARVNQHLRAARQHAEAGAGYVLELPLDTTKRWNAGLVTYWKRFGDRIGETVKAAAVPPNAGRVTDRAVRVHPNIVKSLAVHDLNLVFQRIEPVQPDEGFDLILATNILLYYDVFEQSLILANVATMLRPGGVFLSNDLLSERTVGPALPINPMNLAGYIDVPYTDSNESDRFVWFQKR